MQSESIQNSTPMHVDHSNIEITSEEEIPAQTQSTPYVKNPTPTWASSLTLEVNSNLEVKCVETFDELPPTKVFPGVLAIEAGLLNLDTLQRVPFDQKILYGELVSPNRSQIAVKYDNSEYLLILNNEGAVMQKIYLPSLIPIYWLDNSTLVLHEEIINPPLYKTLPSFILDLGTEIVSQIPTDSELIHTLWDGLGSKWERSQVTDSSISPNHNYLVFARLKEDGMSEMVLWDLTTNTEISQILSDIHATLPRWNSTGSSFLASLPAEYLMDNNLVLSYTGYELFQIFTDGKVEKLSDLSDINPSIQFDFVWSPDDKRIAFRMEYFSELSKGPIGLEEAHLALMNVQTGKVEDFCIVASDLPVWSPSGEYVAIRSGGEMEKVYIIDIENHEAYLVYESASAKILGWMDE